MKRIVLTILGGALAFFLFTSQALAQDFKNTNPKMNHVLADDKLVRATEVTVEPGEKSDMHTHPAHFYYALTEGKMKIHYSDGKEEILEMKPGESGVSAPERPHTTENVGTTTLKFLIVELKEHPYKSGNKK